MENKIIKTLKINTFLKFKIKKGNKKKKSREKNINDNLSINVIRNNFFYENVTKILNKQKALII